MQFIQPAKIHNEDFKSQWLRADKEEVYELTIPSEQKMYHISLILGPLKKLLVLLRRNFIA